MSKGFIGVGISAMLFIIALIVLTPFAVIWALNTLFGLMIPFGIKTYVATLILLMCLGTLKTSKK